MEPKEIYPKLFKSTEATLRNNTYYIDDDKKIQIDASEILEKPVDILVLTHSHVDHVYMAKEIKEKTGCKIAASAEACDHLKRLAPPCLAGLSPKKLEPINVDIILDNGATISTQNFRLKVIKTPGHSSGCISLWEPSKKILFSGDCWFGRDSIGRHDLPSSDKKSLMDSVKKLKELKPVLLCPGHDY